MKIDSSEVVDARTAAIEFLDGDILDHERLAEALVMLNADDDLLSPAMLSRLALRAAWHIRAIGSYHMARADDLEESSSRLELRNPHTPSVLRGMRAEAQQYFETAERWERHSRNVRARSRRRRFRVVSTQLRLPGVE